jgi:hypothetical protein
MTALRLSYAELGARLGRSTDAARVLARRKGWRRVTGNDGRVIVLVDEGELPPERPAERSPEQPDTAALRERIARLEGEASGHAARVADLHNALADLAGRLDRATAELADLRRPWWRGGFRRRT